LSIETPSVEKNEDPQLPLKEVHDIEEGTEPISQGKR
jgi:hypothetical protein